MIPLVYILLIWIVLLGIFGFMLMLTLVQTLRHGLPTAGGYLSTFIFLAVVAVVILGVGVHLSTVDLSTPVQLIPEGAAPFTTGL